MINFLVLVENDIDNYIFNTYTKDYFDLYSKKINIEYNIIYSYNEFKRYLNSDKLLVIKASCLIKPDTPNILDEYKGSIVSLLESPYRNNYNQIQRIIRENNFEKIDWDYTYFNLDVFIIYKEFYSYINPENVSNIKDNFQYKLIKNKDIVESLNYNFNRCSFQDKNIGNHRLSSYIINYNGGIKEQLDDIIPYDINEINNGTIFKRNILISNSGGLGDEMDSEPVVRYIINKEFKDSKFYIISNFPWIYDHLHDGNDILVYDYATYSSDVRLSHEPIILRTMPDDVDNQHGMSHIFLNSTDYASISSVKKILINADKTIMTKHIDYVDNHYINSIPKDILSDMLLVHPSKWWDSKTFPKDWWDSVIYELKKYKPIGIIGKNISNEQMVVDVNKDGVYDFVDKTNINELKYLLKYTSGILSNDSGPIHLAGAFDNWIFVIPTCKHPEHILPFRYGSQGYKTLSLYNKLLIDDLFISVVNFDNQNSRIDKIPEGHNIEEYLLDPKILVDKVLNVL